MSALGSGHPPCRRLAGNGTRVGKSLLRIAGSGGAAANLINKVGGFFRDFDKALNFSDEFAAGFEETYDLMRRGGAGFTADDLAGLGRLGDRGFQSFGALKRHLGPNKPGQVYHHLVEQHGDNVAKFGAESIQNTGNVIEIPHGKGTIHNLISAFYSSKRPFTNGLTVRQWLKPQSFAEQYEFGVDAVKRFGGSEYLPSHLR
ncbi:MAG: hypothetical protein HC888_14295 [Candidatus Competibacteraceae bacterium]|nr:hypothetical protein [Candidatus Competibacteraceae bacterium]